MTAARLQIVDDNGELRDPLVHLTRDELVDRIGELDAKVAGLTSDCDVLHEELTRALRQIKAFKQDREKERLGDPERDVIIGVFDYWREKCQHPNSRFDGKRFDLIKSRLKQFSPDELMMAIDGAAVDAYVDPKGKRHDRLGLILESAERVEDFCNRFARWQRRNGVQSKVSPGTAPTAPGMAHREERSR